MLPDVPTVRSRLLQNCRSIVKFHCCEIAGRIFGSHRRIVAFWYGSVGEASSVNPWSTVELG